MTSNMLSQDRGLTNQGNDVPGATTINNNPPLGAYLSNSTNDRLGNTQNFPSAQRVIEEFESAIERVSQRLQSSSLNNTTDQSSGGLALAELSVTTMRIFDVAPTELNNEFHSTDPAPAVLTAQIYMPRSFTCASDGTSRIRREYTLTRGPCTVNLRAPARTSVTQFNVPELRGGIERLFISGREQADGDMDMDMEGREA